MVRGLCGACKHRHDDMVTCETRRGKKREVMELMTPTSAAGIIAVSLTQGQTMYMHHECIDIGHNHNGNMQDLMLECTKIDFTSSAILVSDTDILIVSYSVPIGSF
jgi:hypothetical protein